MRRAVSSFTVEVRRRPRLAITSKSHVQLSEIKSPGAGFDRESHRVAAAAFEAKKVDPSSVDAESSRRGRILPSLVSDQSRHRLLEDAPVSAADSEPPSLAPKRPSDQASKSLGNSSFSSDENAPLAQRLSTKSRRMSRVQSDEGAGTSTRIAMPVPGSPETPATLAQFAKAGRRDHLAISCNDDRAKPLLNDQRSAIGTDSPATHHSGADDRSPQGRKRNILARYVFGDELKPGERWKRRLLTTR